MGFSKTFTVRCNFCQYPQRVHHREHCEYCLTLGFLTLFSVRSVIIILFCSPFATQRQELARQAARIEQERAYQGLVIQRRQAKQAMEEATERDRQEQERQAAENCRPEEDMNRVLRERGRPALSGLDKLGELYF